MADSTDRTLYPGDIRGEQHGDGIFTSRLSSEKVLTNTHALASIVPSPVPEPATLVVFLACGAGLIYRGRRRIAAAELMAR